MVGKATPLAVCLAVGVLFTAPVCFAGAGSLPVPGLPDEGGDVARDVLQQLGAGIIPPQPMVPGGGAPASMMVLSEIPELPELPGDGDDVARDVLQQLGAGIIPPQPMVPDGGAPASMMVLWEVPELPGEGDDVARDVLQQLGAGIIPPEPMVPGESAGGAAMVPEPVTMLMLLAGGFAVIRRKRA